MSALYVPVYTVFCNYVAWYPYTIRGTTRDRIKGGCFFVRGFLILVNFTALRTHTLFFQLLPIFWSFVLYIYLDVCCAQKKIELNYICQMTWLIMCVFVCVPLLVMWWLRGGSPAFFLLSFVPWSSFDFINHVSTRIQSEQREQVLH